VTLFRETILLDRKTGRSAMSISPKDWRVGIGNTLCYRRDWWKQHPFPVVGIGEDMRFQFEAEERSELTISDGRNLVVMCLHGINTCDYRFKNWVVGSFEFHN
jgi:hypothetical protein